MYKKSTMLYSILHTFLNIYVHIKLFFVQSVSKLYRKYPKLDQIDKMIRYNMYSGYKWWHSIRSEPVNENKWLHFSSIIQYDQGQRAFVPTWNLSPQSTFGAQGLRPPSGVSDPWPNKMNIPRFH